MFSLAKFQSTFSYCVLIYLHLTWILLATPQFSTNLLPQQSVQQESPGPLDTNGAPKAMGGGATPKNEKSEENYTAHFFLWNSSASELKDQLVLMEEDGTVPADLWTPGGAIKVIAHGYHADYTLTPVRHLDDHKIPVIAEEYAKANSTLNIIIVEWSAMAIRVAYPVSAENTKVVGKATAKFLLNLFKKKSFRNWADVHLIGFSLGGHLAGVAGYQVQKLSNNKHKIGRITGLDPAGPLFDLDGGHMPEDVSGYLEKSDADFVDIIHCNMGTQHWSRALPDGRLGSYPQAGHADFYPNGGENQFHQCTIEMDKSTACSHRCCVFFYAFSLTRPELACRCKSWEDYSNGLCPCTESTGAYLGDPCTRKAKGKYYVEMKEDLNTTEVAPQEAPPLAAEHKIESVATKAETFTSEGASTDVVTNRVSSTRRANASASVPDGTDVQGPAVPQGSPQSTGPASLPGASMPVAGTQGADTGLAGATMPQGADPGLSTASTRHKAPPPRVSNMQDRSFSGAGTPQSRSSNQNGGPPQFGPDGQPQGPQRGPPRPGGDKEDGKENDTVNFFLWDKKGATLDDRLVHMNENGTVPKQWRHGGELKVIAHGYHADYSLTPLEHLEDHKIPIIAEEYAKANRTLNIIIVEWSGLAIRAAYPESAENTKPVGKATAEFLLKLHSRRAFHSFEQVHLIGFSLGSHLAGVAGYQVQELSNHTLKIGRITGLDPAGPLFDMDGGHMPNDTTGFLEKSDANFVDIIHCNMGTMHWSRAIPEGKLGSHVQAGHADFYPNGGWTQHHQCTEELDRMIACSHRCCVFFYAFSLTRPEMGCPCKSWKNFSSNKCRCDKSKGAYLGDPCTRKARGKYFVEMKEDLNMTNIVPKEMPNIKADKQAERVATRFEKGQVDGGAPDAVSNRMAASNPNGNVSFPDANGGGLPPPQSGGLPPPQSGGLPPPQSGGLPPPQSDGPNLQNASLPGGAGDGAPKIGGDQNGAPQFGAPQPSTPGMDGANMNGSKIDAPKMDSPKLDGPKMDAPKVDAPKLDAPKTNGSRMDDHKMEHPKMDMPKGFGRSFGNDTVDPSSIQPIPDTEPEEDASKEKSSKRKKKKPKETKYVSSPPGPGNLDGHKKNVENKLKHMLVT